ncbi:hypothetical protein AV530_013357 [Patagioenas fasciata monilis]|uniref:Uncharacterized protein n=1 Tax=Patagioenas fasciata monilis TaxID=372326 RepID=A0A1V4JPB9_PATFA|nr:hypothetical protein AV530_013357 [Patagioenas fasciata monilis]
MAAHLPRLVGARGLVGAVKFGMASQVLVYPPYVYQTQSSAFCSVKKLKLEPSSCVYHERTYPQIYVNGKNFGISPHRVLQKR